VVDFGNCGSVKDHSSALQIVRERDCLSSLKVYRVDSTNMSFLCYHESIRNKDMWGNTEIGVVIRRKIRTCYLCFPHTPVFTDSLVLEDSQRMNKVLAMKVTFHIFPINIIQRVLSLYRLSLFDPYSQLSQFLTLKVPLLLSFQYTSKGPYNAFRAAGTHKDGEQS